MRVIYPVVCALAAVAVAGTLYAQSSNKQGTNTTHVSPARKYSYAVVNPDGSITCSGTWNSSEWEALRKRSKERLLYVRKDGTMYVIEDKLSIDQVLAAFKPIQDLSGPKIDKSKEHSKFGKEMAEYGKQLGDLIHEQVNLQMQLGRDAEKDREIRKRLEELEKKQRELNSKMVYAGSMGVQMSEWGKKMGAAAKEADAKATKVIDNAFERGLAKKA